MKTIKHILLFCALWFGIQNSAVALTVFKEGTIIRDAEIEQVLRDFTKPIFEAAGLNPKDLQLFVIVDDTINAAATTNYTFLLNTGFLTGANNASEIIGVLAHETGHIADGHIARSESAMAKSQLLGLGAMALAAAAAYAGRPQSGTGIGSDVTNKGGSVMYDSIDAYRNDASAIVGTGMAFGLKNLMKYSRGQEGSADQAAIKFLNKLDWSPQGLFDFMKKLHQQELLSPEMQDPYMLSHPLTTERLEAFKQAIAKVPQTKAIPHKFETEFQLIKAKLIAFLKPAQVIIKYPSKDTSPEARYARAIAAFRNSNMEQALTLMDGLIKDFPNNAYFYEQKGQILYESGKLPQAIDCFHQAVERDHRNSPIIRLFYAQALIESENPASLTKAKEQLLGIMDRERFNPNLWYSLSVVYGREGDMGKSALYLAEKALCERKYEIAEKQAKRALTMLKNDVDKLQANDILKGIDAVKKDSPSSEDD